MVRKTDWLAICLLSITNFIYMFQSSMPGIYPYLKEVCYTVEERSDRFVYHGELLRIHYGCIEWGTSSLGTRGRVVEQLDLQNQACVH